MAGRDVDRDAGERGARQPGPPGRGLFHGIGQYLFVDRDQQAGLLGHVNERRRQPTAARARGP
jgi:hypothetical protein